MNYYTITIKVQNSDGEKFELVTDRNFESHSDAYIFATGLEEGLMQAHNAFLCSKEIAVIKR